MSKRIVHHQGWKASKMSAIQHYYFWRGDLNKAIAACGVSTYSKHLIPGDDRNRCHHCGMQLRIRDAVKDLVERS